MSLPSRFPPGPFGHPFIGCLPEMQRDILGFLTRARRDHGDLAGFRVLWARFCLLGHPNYIEQVLVRDSEKFIKSYDYRQLSYIVGDGLLTSDGDTWRRQRRLAQPIFHNDRIRAYVPIFVRRTEEMCRQWAGRTRVDIHVELMRLTLVIVSEALFRTVVEDDTATVGRALDVISRQFVGFKFPFWLPTPGNVRALWQLRKLNRIVYRFIRERAGADERAPGGADDLLSHLLAARDDQGRPMSERQLRDELMTVFLAGHETTAIALSFTLWLIARHPDVEERLLAEYAQVLEDRNVTAADLPQLEFTRAVVQESMRLYPPVWGLGRENVDEYAIGDHVLPPRTIIFPCQYLIHHDERFYDDPERFDPDRWLRGIEARNPRYAYFPFGAGPRACIGAGFAMLEMAAVLATLLRAYRFSAVDEQVELVPAITLRPRDGIQLMAERRSSAASVAP